MTVTNGITHNLKVGQKVRNINHTAYDAEYVILKITQKRIVCKELDDDRNYQPVSFSPENLFSN